MSPPPDIGGISISASDWEVTPVSVKALVAPLVETISRLEDRVSHLEEQLNQNSQNSSRPPSKDGFGAPKATPKGNSKGIRQRGAQPGHPGHSRKLYPPEAYQSTFEHRLEVCAHCGEALSGDDPVPYRHQIVELPPMVPMVTEHRLHALC